MKNALNVELQNDPDLLSDILSALAKKIESGMNLHRTNILGKVPKTRDDFIPSILLEKLEGGAKVVVLDSNQDLPKDWDLLDIKAKYGVDMANEVPGQDGLSSDGGSSDGGSSDGVSTDGGISDGGSSGGGGGLSDCASDGTPNRDREANSDTDQESCLDPDAKPPRVLVFTTSLLLALLSVCRSGSVDGTFKAMSKQWKQLFILMVDYKGAFIPVAFGWLPNKTEVSYHIFIVMVMEAFYAQREQNLLLFGRSKLKLKKIKLDFEKAIHNALGVLFSLKGCFFHFR